ncbi:hypothetical protein QQ054_30425 [Oscillatoria amoena NRMC-F 0135]|nr:hypothetical protein [Oscillatoria amoena NRMC-F 0135]
MAQFAKVVLERNLDKEFDYLIPDSLLGVVQVGSKVRVPFGRQILMGFVSSVMSHPDYPDCKPITRSSAKNHSSTITCWSWPAGWPDTTLAPTKPPCAA